MAQKLRTYASLLDRPWVIEAILFFLVLWQEDLRLGLRTRRATLPVPAALQRFYYFNFGDFVNGYVNAFIIDGLGEMIASWLVSRHGSGGRVTRWWLARPGARAAAACACSAAIIIAFELRTSAFTTADLADIPAGVLGAVVYLAARLAALGFRRRQPAI